MSSAAVSCCAVSLFTDDHKKPGRGRWCRAGDMTERGVSPPNLVDSFVLISSDCDFEERSSFFTRSFLAAEVLGRFAAINHPSLRLYPERQHRLAMESRRTIRRRPRCTSRQQSGARSSGRRRRRKRERRHACSLLCIVAVAGVLHSTEGGYGSCAPLRRYSSMLEKTESTNVHVFGEVRAQSALSSKDYEHCCCIG